MGRIVVSENMSLDGVVEDPSGDEGTPAGGWFDRLIGADRDAWAQLELEEARGAAALLLGRRSEAFFARRWSSRTGEWAERLNAIPKYVVSSTLRDPAWTNSSVLSGDAVEEVSRLKARIPGEIVVYGSRQLVRTLLEHDLVDELRLVVFPVVLGTGGRLFGETGTALRLLRSAPVGDGLALLVYEAARAAAGASPPRPA